MGTKEDNVFLKFNPAVICNQGVPWEDMLFDLVLSCRGIRFNQQQAKYNYFLTCPEEIMKTREEISCIDTIF